MFGFQARLGQQHLQPHYYSISKSQLPNPNQLVIHKHAQPQITIPQVTHTHSKNKKFQFQVAHYTIGDKQSTNNVQR
jgi:hypothetical protein